MFKSLETAFPISGSIGIKNLTGIIEPGLSKRQFIAAMAMQAIINSNPALFPEQAARQAVMYADALLKELKQKT